MATEANRPNQTGNQNPDYREDFISFAEILGMILRHRRKIAVIVMLVTIVSAVFFLLSPRQYQAEGFLQVISPTKPDSSAFETTIISHLQAIQSAFIAKEVADTVNAQSAGTAGAAITPLELQGRVKIARPPKSYLITVTGTFSSPDQAILIVRTWIQKYLVNMRKNNINTTLCQVRELLKLAQSGLMETQAKANQLKMSAEQTKPLVDLARGINNNQLWREVAENVPAEKLKNLSNISFNSQEQNSDYLTIKAMLHNAEQSLAAVAANCNFLRDVEKYLEYKTLHFETNATGTVNFSSNAVEAVETMLKISDVIEMGEPALKSAARGALRKTAIAFFITLIAASLGAYLCEWCKTIKF